MKLWDKGVKVDKKIEQFTVGMDRELDLQLAAFDVLGSLAHIEMLESIGLLEKTELKLIQEELRKIYSSIKNNDFVIDDGTEDVHSQIEYQLTLALGDIGKKIHSGRSRNDQVLLDLKLFTRNKLEEIVREGRLLFDELIAKSNENKDVLIPGYTHLQVAMPSSFGLWFGAYAESLSDDMMVLQAAYKVVNQNPLGSGAGYGSSFPLNRQMTTDLLGFRDLSYNVVYAQMGRGKMEFTVLSALASMAMTIGKLAMDACLYNSQNFNFLSFPDELTTGSSIMPHKKNPDVFELIRAHANALQMLPAQIQAVTSNLPSGYHRDYQLTKEFFMPAFDKMIACLEMTRIMLSEVKINKEVLKDERYKYMFTVEEVNRMVLNGVPFRDAYKKIGQIVEEGTFKYEGSVKHVHEGSIGNLCNDKIVDKMNEIFVGFNFNKTKEAYMNLLNRI
ncbi:argininosuccinate lyase [Labilibaculum euxinus]|uniref:Argininosuccinate lyase n=1 Tax=Labilibaculum euxinus TaxID=2686357 RepID=A0A7M4D4L9_9BACT|nr:argininosuccinate lyase [Labilibaculum euxinus]MUP37598.1 argininosuccinate lyase [Labilibaculum euxinus]MVB06803.1 argininosuccinate lyase [Labilibaculum euxinus]